MAVINYRRAISEAIRRVMAADERVVFLGEDVGRAGGAFKSTVGLFEAFGDRRVFDTPISEQAIVGAAMGAAMRGYRPIAEIMFSDFLAVCWDGVANQMAKLHYMTGGQISLPLVLRSHSGAGAGFGAQHSQSVENWAMAVPGLKVVAPSSPTEVVALLAAAVDDPDPVLFFENKSLFAMKEDVPDDVEKVVLGKARSLRQGNDVSIVSLGGMVPIAAEAAQQLAAEDIHCDVIDLRSLVPLDWETVMDSVAKTGRLVTVEENPRPCGWGAEVSSMITQHAFNSLAGPVLRVTSPAVPVPFARTLEEAMLPSVADVVGAVRQLK